MLVKINNLNEDIKKFEEILVLFYAEWCGYCSNFKPIFIEMANKSKGTCGTVNISDEMNPLWDKLKIEAVPTMILYKNAKISDRTTGGLEQPELLSFMKKNNLK